MRPHSLATLMAVRMLSPVHITVRIPASLNSVITGVVVSFNLFSKTMKPRKLRPDSACSLGILCIFLQLKLGSYFAAQAITRYPLCV